VQRAGGDHDVVRADRLGAAVAPHLGASGAAAREQDAPYLRLVEDLQIGPPPRRRVEIADGRRRAYGPGGELWGDSAILEEDPPRRLVNEWQGLYDPDLAAEETSRVTWEIEPQDGGITKLTLIHDQLEGAPKPAESVANGWMFVLSGLKTLLETGQPLAG